MTTTPSTLLTYKSLDFTPYEIRGVKSGINNAQTTGPVYVNGQYIPSSSAIIGDGSFSPNSNIVTDFYFEPPYSSLDTSALFPNDSLSANNSLFFVSKRLTADSFELDSSSGFEGTYQITFGLGQRSYVVEPDVITNTSTGQANFYNGSTTVTVSSTTGFSVGDFIRSNSYLVYYRIKNIPSSTELELVSPYAGVTAYESYVSKKWAIGNTDIRYSTDNIVYDTQAAKWKYDSTTGSGLPTSLNYIPLADGLNERFTSSLVSTAPDIMDVNTVSKTFSKSTIYDTFQYSLPVVPHPETMQLKINQKLVDQFPQGNQDYVLSFSQSPLYTPPPPPDQRQVANIMFLKGVKNVQPSPSSTSSGQMQLLDSSGAAITGIMPGSENITLNGSTLTPYKDYALEPYSGILEITDSIINEPVVKYVGVSYNSVIDYGFTVYLNGVKQQISFPSSPTDDIIFQPDTGKFKPQAQDHPGPNDIYEMHYMVEAQGSLTDAIQAQVGQTQLKTSLYPIKQGSMIVSKAGAYLSEGEDYVVSYLTGTIILLGAVTTPSTFSVTYTALSKQVNNMTYTDGTSFCTVIDARLTVLDAPTYKFQLYNTALSFDSQDITVLRVYNETRNKDYDLTGLSGIGNTIGLSPTLNASIGLGAKDIVVVDYKFPNETVEYVPVSVNYLNILTGFQTIYLEGIDLTTSVSPGAILNLGLPDSASQFYYVVDTVVYDGLGTRVTIKGSISQDITNPKIFFSDSFVMFLPILVTADPIISGSTTISFSGSNISNLFRQGTLIDVLNNLYLVLSATFDGSKTQVTLTSEIVKDCTDAIALSLLTCSDAPVYNEGTTEIIPFEPIVTLKSQPAFILNGIDNRILNVVSDSSSIHIDNTSFLYSNYPTLGTLSTALSPIVSVLNYVPSWQSNKIIPTASTVYKDSSTVLYASNALRYSNQSPFINFVDTTNFNINEPGVIELTNPIKQYDRYNLDYMGRRFLNTSQVAYSLKYFTILPAKSNVFASFEYDNLDQFYIQVLDQKDFFSSVTIPRMQSEALQLNGNTGQGGSVYGDESQDPSSGGLAGNEYKRQDEEIECRIFKKIYDFFQNRLTSYGLEMEAATGPKLFNNDGIFSEEQQLAANKSINRIFSKADYTNMEPMICNPLTGYYTNVGAIFTQGSADVVGVGTQWSYQLTSQNLPLNSVIKRTDSTALYNVYAINSNNSLTLDRPFEEQSTSDTINGESYTAASPFPLYDDDGYIGPKHVGSKNNNFNLVSGDVFTCTLDSSDSTYVFLDPLIRFGALPLPPQLIAALQPPVSKLNIAQIAEQLTSNIPGLSATVENVVDPTQSYGYLSTMVLRASYPINYLKLGDNATTSKLGFVPGAVSIGNFDRNSHLPEIISDSSEAGYLVNEAVALIAMFDEYNRMDRINNDLVNASTAINGEIDSLNNEIPKIEAQISALNQIIKEPSIITSYTDASAALLNASIALDQANAALGYNLDILTLDWKWPINFQEFTQDFTNINGLTSITLTVTPDPLYDPRILNYDIPLYGLYTPVVTFSDGSIVGGTWTGWDGSVGGNYSATNQIQFNLANTPVFTIQAGAPVSNAYYITDSTALNLYWKVGGVADSTALVYSDSTVGYIKNIINGISGFSTSGDPVYNDYSSAAFKLNYSPINPNATVYYGLRDATITYQTISELTLNQRYSFATGRYPYLTDTRTTQLNTREGEIRNDLAAEEILKTETTGVPGDLYTWANNRFNRRQGCYAKLKQIEQQIASNQTALNINKSLMP